MWVLKACASGLIGYVFPRLLVELGVPVDSWIVAMASWLSPHSLQLTPTAALWLASFIIFVALYGFALWYSRSDANRSRGRTVGIGPLVIIVGVLICLAGAAIWFFETREANSAAKFAQKIERETDERHRADPIDKAFLQEFRRDENVAAYNNSLKLPIIDEAIELLKHNGDFEQPIDDAGRLHDAVVPQLKAGHRDELLKRLDSLRERFIANSQRIGAIYVKTESIHGDISAILVQPYQNALIEGIYELSGALKKLDNPVPTNVEYWIKPALDKFKEGIHGVGRWRGTALFQLFDLRKKLTT